MGGDAADGDSDTEIRRTGADVVVPPMKCRCPESAGAHMRGDVAEMKGDAADEKMISESASTHMGGDAAKMRGDTAVEEMIPESAERHT